MQVSKKYNVGDIVKFANSGTAICKKPSYVADSYLSHCIENTYCLIISNNHQNSGYIWYKILYKNKIVYCSEFAFKNMNDWFKKK